MKFNLPKDDSKFRWTQHVVRKMMFYGLSPDRVKRVIRAPQRMEVGIAPETKAAMQKAGTPKKPTEIWVMWAERTDNRQQATDNNRKSSVVGRKSSVNNNFLQSQKVIITAWRYPGVSPVRDELPIPSDILAELKKELALLN